MAAESAAASRVPYPLLMHAVGSCSVPWCIDAIVDYVFHVYCSYSGHISVKMQRVGATVSGQSGLTRTHRATSRGTTTLQQAPFAHRVSTSLPQCYTAATQSLKAPQAASSTATTAPASQEPFAMPESDLEQAALRVREMEQQAIQMHERAQQLNKEGKFAGGHRCTRSRVAYRTGTYIVLLPGLGSLVGTRTRGTPRCSGQQQDPTASLQLCNCICV